MIKKIILGCLLAVVYGLPLSALENPRSLAEVKPDPLLPSLKRPLSPLEQRSILAATEQLSQEAQQWLAANESDRAFDLWFRALNLQRFLGTYAEIFALGQVAEEAWEAGEKIELQAITQRLQTIGKSLEKQENWLAPEIDALGLAYQQARDLNAATRIYQSQLEAAQANTNREKIAEILTQLIQIQWGSLNYALAADYTQQQLTLLRSQPITRANLLEERSLLQSLAFFYQQAEDYAASIEILEEVIALTLDLGLEAEVAPLQVRLAQAQMIAGEISPATKTYRQAYLNAQQQQQFELAQEILFALGTLHEQQGQLPEAIQVYELLRQVHRYSSNLIGLLESYDRLGRLYLQTNNMPLALEQFQKGLELARRLQYREVDFATQLEQLN